MATHFFLNPKRYDDVVKDTTALVIKARVIFQLKKVIEGVDYQESLLLIDNKNTFTVDFSKSKFKFEQYEMGEDGIGIRTVNKIPLGVSVWIAIAADGTQAIITEDMKRKVTYIYSNSYNEKDKKYFNILNISTSNKNHSRLGFYDMKTHLDKYTHPKFQITDRERESLVKFLKSYYYKKNISKNLTKNKILSTLANLDESYLLQTSMGISYRIKKTSNVDYVLMEVSGNTRGNYTVVRAEFKDNKFILETGSGDCYFLWLKQIVPVKARALAEMLFG